MQQTIDGVVTTYTYNDNDHLLSETENSVVTSYLYDDNGNTLEKVVDGLIDTEYSYSKDNRMLSANTGTSTISYTYDAGGIRQSQTVDGLTTHFLVDPNRSYHQVLEEQDDLFIPQVIYTYGDDLISQTNEQGTHTFGYDGLGSTRILTDSTGTVQNSYGYQAYGEISHQSGSVDNKYLFTGEQYDESLFQYYLRARYYNHEIGRFTQMDTWKGKICSPITLNKYVYVNANPINRIDPSGNMALVSQMQGISLQGTFNTVRISTVAKGALVAATATAVYVVANRAAEQKWTMAMVHSSPNVKSESDRVAYEGNRQEYKNRCGEKFPGGGSQCDKWRWELRRNRDCADMREEFSSRWYNGTDGTHQQAIDEMRRAAEKLESKINRICGR